MKNLTYIFLTTLFILLLSNCGRKSLPPAIQVKPEGIHLEVNKNQLFEFTVHAFSDDKELRNITITRKQELGITETILDTTVQGKTVDFFYHYFVLPEDDQAVFNFTVYDKDGESGSTAKRLFIAEEESLLEETQGYSLYSKYSILNPNAFNIATNTFYQLPTNPDSSLVDLVEFDQENDSQLSNTLTSWSGIEFVKNNSFNYAEATNASAEASYTSSSANQIVGDIAVGDIIITRYNDSNQKYAVIKITGINNSGDNEQNNYTFNIKK